MNTNFLTELSTPSIPVTQCGYIEETVSLDTMAAEWAARNRRWQALSPKTSTKRSRSKRQQEREERVIFLRTFLFMLLIVLAVAIIPVIVRVNI